MARKIEFEEKEIEIIKETLNQLVFKIGQSEELIMVENTYKKLSSVENGVGDNNKTSK